MRVLSIGACPSIVYRGVNIKNVKTQDNEIVQAAKKELEMIKAQGQVAGTDAAWWRSGFSEAKAVLESIVNNEVPVQTKHSGLMSFHDYEEDGLI